MKKKKTYTKKELEEFIRESNYIESEYSEDAFEDAMEAWKFAEKCEVMTPGHILTTHALLARRIRPDIAGKWRTCDVWIGGKKKKFVSVQKIEDDIALVLELLDENPGVDPGAWAQHCHVLFEEAHPFEDFNGRSGRILWNWHRVKLGLPLKIIHADWDRDFNGKGEQRSYYKLFR